MDEWDQNKLESVIKEKHGAANQTDIVCKYFLDAIEKAQYGWFWVCPNGGKSCKYRHALPPGYVFQSKKDRELKAKMATGDGVESIEEIIEAQRKAFASQGGGTPVTEASFAAWKIDKVKRKAAEEEKKRKEDAKKSGGRHMTGSVLSGRALFTFDPTLFRDDDEAEDDDDDLYRHPMEEDNDDDDDEEEKQPLPAALDEAAKYMDASLYVEDVEADQSLDELLKGNDRKSKTEQS
jgi:hypothetical protein